MKSSLTKLMNVGGLNQNGVTAHTLAPARFREFVCNMPSNRALRLPCKCMFLPTAEDGGAGTDRRIEHKPALPWKGYYPEDQHF